MATGASYFTISSSDHRVPIIVSGKFGGKPTMLDIHENKRKLASSWRLRVQTNIHAKWMMDDHINHANFEQLGLGSKVDSSLFHQTFDIRSYEIGAYGKASIETIMNHLQEAIVCSGKLIGFDSSSVVTWVVTRMQVEVDRYPTWGDVVWAIEPRLTISGKHGLRCEWLFCDSKTNEVLVRASSNMVMMNISTRRLSKFSDEIRARLDPFVVDSPPVIVKDTRILPKLDETTADHVCSGLMPRWSDLDINEHVSNVKYVGWIIESIPESIVKNYELASMTLEYHRECGRECILQSLTSVLRNDNDHVECHHMLRLEDGGGVIMKGWTRWRPKCQTT